MTTKILFSIVVLEIPILIYVLVIWPRLKARFADTYQQIDGFWARLWARIVAFRSWVIATIGIWISEVPALLEELRYIDLSDWWPGWQSTVRVIVIGLLLYNIARKTTPAGQPEPH